MADSLEDLTLKLDRAEEQLASLQGKASAFLVMEPYKLLSEYDAKRRCERFYFELTRQPPIMWGIEVGEIAHHLRSCLDHMVHIIVAAKGSKKPGRWTRFPTASSPIDFLRQAYFPDFDQTGCLTGLDWRDQEVAFIEALQPYNRPNGPENDGITILTKLSNVDKHRVIHTAAFLPRTPGRATFRVAVAGEGIANDADGEARIEYTFRPGMRLDKQTEVVRIYLTDRDKAHMDVEAKLPIDVAFEAEGSVASIKALQEVGGLIRLALETTKRLIEPDSTFRLPGWEGS